ncbi:MAG: 30S ribosomal protein S6 [Patescibacteria group bacterium]|jgi:small subunit ribosomal protein S6|nr:30S ribosomal protein S6 [Patescibacteria group bacterium]
MKEYEIAIVYDPDLEVDLSKAEEKVKKIISDNSGKIKKIDNWGKNKLAYPIKHHDFGIYLFYLVDIDPLKIKTIESLLNITDEIIRFLIVKSDIKGLKKAEQERIIKDKKNTQVVKTNKVK